jgi:hypothetical protein
LPNYQDVSFDGGRRRESKMQVIFQNWLVKKYEAKKEELRSWLGTESLVEGQFELEENQVYEDLEYEIENRQRPPKCNGLRKIMRGEWFYTRLYIK